VLQNSKQISYLYNPANQTPQEIKDNFVVRGAEFKRILRDIKNTQEDETPQNFLIIAQRGMGKTTLLLRLQYEIKNDPSLSHLIPIQLSEEQYNIFSLCNLWEDVADELEEIECFKGIAKQLKTSIDNSIENCFDIIKKALVQNKKRIVLLIDNFGDMLDKFSDVESKELRDILHGSHLQMVTASSRVLEETYKHDKALFEYFNLINLKGLSQEETMTLFESLSKIYHDKKAEEILKKQRSRIEIIRRLTGGVPRTMILLFEIFMDESADVFEDLELILDRVTPLYKHRMDDLSPKKLQKIVHEMALAWDGVTFEEIQAKTRIEDSELSSNLLKLEKNNLITVTPIGNGSNIYQLSERFFNIWYLMRRGRKNKKEHILWLVKFLQVWCTPDELIDRAYGHIRLVQGKNINPKGALFMAKALADSIEDKELEYQILFETKKFLEVENFDLVEQLVFKENKINQNQKVWTSNIFRNIKKISNIIYFYKYGVDISMFIAESLSLLSDILDFCKNMKFIGKISNQINIKLHKIMFRLYKRAIKINPNNDFAYLRLGIIYKNKKEYDKAIECYKKAIEVDDKEPFYYNSLGIIYHNQKKYDKAIEYYKKAIEVNDKYVYPYNSLGNIYKNQKEYNKAIEYYKKAIEVNDKFVYAYKNLGKIYRNQKEYDKAIEFYKKAIKTETVSKEKGNIYIAMGIVSAKNRNYNQAIEFGEKALKENPKVYSGVSLIYFYSNKNKKEAIKLINKALKEENNDKNNGIKMMIQVWNREYNESINIFKKFIIEEDEKIDDEDITEYLLFLISQKQYKLTNELFTNKELNLKNRFKPIYYTLMYFMQDKYPTEYKRMGDELRETVEELLVQVRELEEQYR